ncbi:MAG: hypothetical protein ACREMY_05445, partial [bacterium]
MELSASDRGRRNPIRPDTTRSRLVLETASELVGDWGWRYRQARVSLRAQGPNSWSLCFFGSDAPSAFDEVVRGEVQVAIINPAEPLTQAVRGVGPFAEALPLRAITVIPSLDWLAFAVTKATGLTSLAQIAERRYPLRVSLRGQPDHSLHFMMNQVFALYGFSVEDLVAWGGEVRYDPDLPDRPERIGAVARGEIDAIFDEAVNVWIEPALDLDMRILALEEAQLQRL